METVRVQLGKRSYDILIKKGLLGQVAKDLKTSAEGRQIVLMSNDLVYPLYGESLKDDLEQEGFEVFEYIIPDGERYKSWEMAGQILTKMLEHQIGRDALVLALGGGVIGDIAGFVASIYQRGISFYQIPTTLLAQVDSSVGGKVAVNHALGKNMIGSFYQPKKVYIDTDTLQTMPERDWKSGLAEIIKYGIIQDEELFYYLKDHTAEINARQEQVFVRLIKRSCEIKAQIVAADERESGIRAILNLGHTLAHGIEAITEYEYLRHGEAVACGIGLISEFACEQGILQEQDLKEIQSLFAALSMEYRLPKMPAAMFMEMLALDKKNKQGQMVLILPEAIGCVQKTTAYSAEQMRTFLTEKGYLVDE